MKNPPEKPDPIDSASGQGKDAKTGTGHSADNTQTHQVLLADATPPMPGQKKKSEPESASACDPEAPGTSWEQKYQCEQKYIQSHYFSKDHLDKTNFAEDVRQFTGHVNTEADYVKALKKTASDVGDLWTEFKTNDDLAKETEHSKEGFRSAGVWLNNKHGALQIDNVLYGFPAYNSLKIGDKLLALNGKSVVGRPASEIEPLLEGKAGQKLSLDIETKDGQRETVELPIVDPKEMSSSAQIVKDEKTGKSFLKLQMLSFDRDACDQLEDAIKALKKSDLDAVSGVILDLRGNQGGTLAPVIRMADMFVPPGKTLFETISRTGVEVHKSSGFAEDDYTLDADTRRKLRELPLVVLANGTTRSAPETLLGSLQDQHRVKAVVGMNTYGKGVLFYDLDAPEGTLRVSEELVKTSGGRIIHEKGIKADVQVDNPRGSSRDLQQERAIQVLASS